MGFWIDLEVTISRKESDKQFYSDVSLSMAQNFKLDANL